MVAVDIEYIYRKFELAIIKTQDKDTLKKSRML